MEDQRLSFELPKLVSLKKPNQFRVQTVLLKLAQARPYFKRCSFGPESRNPAPFESRIDARRASRPDLLSRSVVFDSEARHPVERIFMNRRALVADSDVQVHRKRACFPMKRIVTGYK